MSFLALTTATSCVFRSLTIAAGSLILGGAVVVGSAIGYSIYEWLMINEQRVQDVNNHVVFVGVGLFDMLNNEFS